MEDLRSATKTVAGWDKAYRHANRKLPNHDSYQHPSLFTFAANGAVSHCVLCAKDLATDLDREGHCEKKEHRLRVRAVHALQQSDIAMHCAMLQNRMDAEMPDRNSHVPMQLEMYWILLNYHPMEGFEWFSKVIAKKATAMVDEYALKQRMWLLELAVWKALCLIRMPFASEATTPDYHMLQDWCRHGWKVNKSATRNSNEIGIILRAVLPFMG
jgi:hypothetical protein